MVDSSNTSPFQNSRKIASDDVRHFEKIEKQCLNSGNLPWTRTRSADAPSPKSRNVLYEQEPSTLNIGQEDIVHQQRNVENTVTVRMIGGQSTKEVVRNLFLKKNIDLRSSRTLGCGRFGKVITAFNTTSQSMIAIRVINTSKITSERSSKFLPREITCWKRLRHPNLVQFLGHYEAVGYVFLTMELGPLGNLLSYIRQNGVIGEEQGRVWSRQILSAIQYMHNKAIAHRYLSAERVIVFNKRCVKIGDFRFAKYVDNEVATTYCGSKSYSAPEILSGTPYDPFKTDIWSIGVVMFVMLTDCMPFSDCANNRQIIHCQRYRRYDYPLSPQLSAECRSLIDRILVYNMKDRITLSECLTSDWLQSDHSSSRIIQDIDDAHVTGSNSPEPDCSHEKRFKFCRKIGVFMKMLLVFFRRSSTPCDVFFRTMADHWGRNVRQIEVQAIVNLLSSDGVLLPVTLKAIKKSEVICRLLYDLSSSSNYPLQIPITNVKSSVLRRIISYLEHHADDIMSAEEYLYVVREGEIESFDRVFMDIDANELLKLTLASNFLHIRQLSTLCSKTFASLLRGKTTAEMRSVLNLRNDFTREEMFQLIIENKWCNDTSIR